MASSYGELRANLGIVRRAWKRRAMTKGLAKTTVETVGVVTLFVLVDWLYSFNSGTRLALLAAGLGFLAYVFVREVLGPALRHIPDDQLALYVEERYPQCDGSVIAATEFGRETEGSSSYGFFVEALISDALGRTREIDLSRLVELKGLRKYGLAAMGLLIFFFANSVLFPRFREQSVRVLAPWTTIEEERRAALLAGEKGFYDISLKGPIQFRVEPESARIVRGGSVQVVGVLSRQPEDGASLLFRPAGTDKWQAIRMDEVDRLYGYSARMTDITEDIEYCVGSGPIFRSPAFKISVYDPLAVKAIEVTGHYPEYLEMEPVVSLGTSGDITMPVGSRARVRIIGNHALREGRIIFEDGTELQMSGGEKPEQGATGEISIEKDTSYTFRIVNHDGEELASPEYFYVRALPDNPPTLDVLTPKADLTVHHLSEITFSALVSDDFGVESARLVYKICEPDSQKEFTTPLTWGTEENPQEATASLVMSLEELADPKIVPDQFVFYHLEATDRKGQKITSDVYNVTIARLEVPGFWPKDRGHAPSGEFEGPKIEIMVFIAACWNLEQERGKLPEKEFNEACGKLHKQMADVQDPGSPMDFVGQEAREYADPEMLRLHDAKVLSGWNLLGEHEPGKAAEEFRMAFVFQKRAFPMGIYVAKAKWQGVANPYNELVQDGARSHVSFDANMSFVDEAPALEAELPPDDYLSRQLDYRRKLNNERQKAAAEATKKADEIATEQERIEEKARELAQREEPAGDDQRAADENEADERRQADAGGQQSEEGEQRERQGEAGARPAEDQKAEGEAGQQRAERSEEGSPDGEQRERRNKGAGSEKEQLVEDQMKLAEAVRKAADQFARKTDPQDRGNLKVVRDLREAAKTMDQAAADFQRRQFDRGAAKAKRAKEEIEEAANRLRASQYQNLEDAIHAAEDVTAELLRRQRKVNEATRNTYAEALKRAEREAQKPRKDGSKPTKEEALREILENPPADQNIKQLAKKQAQIYHETDKLTQYLKDLAKWAAQAKKEEATKELNRANKDIAQRRFPQKMVDAAINLTQKNLPKATEAQNDATETLARVADGLRQASDSLAGTKESLVRRAARQAQQVAEQAERLNAREEKGEAQGDDGKREPDQAREAGEQTPEERDRPQAGAEDDEKGPITDPADRARATAELLTKTRRLVRYLEEEKVIDQKMVDYLKRTSRSGRSFQEMFDEKQKERADHFVKATRTARVSLQKSLKSLLEQKRLHAAQREDCPPKYRKMVNSYFEALSSGGTE